MLRASNVVLRASWALVLAGVLGCPAGGDGEGSGSSSGSAATTADPPAPASAADASSAADPPTSSGGPTSSGPATAGEDSAGDETGGGAADLTPKLYAADDPHIQYSGRIDFTDPTAPTFSAPGVYVTTHFRGVEAAVLLEDQFVWGNDRNFYEVIVDGAASKLAPEMGIAKYTVASGLANAEHSITVVKRTESALGWSKFRGFEFAGEIAGPPPKPARRMIFIGDSITVGSGNEAANGSAECGLNSYGAPGGWGQPYHNNWRSYGALTARSLDAEYHVTAVSGIGLVRNYSFLYDARPMPAVYDLMFLELQQGSPPWDPQRFVPDAVVVALGTNDFSTGDSERPRMTVAEFKTAYVAFVTKLRGYYPDAHIFCASSPMLGDGYPTPADQFLTDQRAALAAVEAELQAAGDAKVHKFDTTKLIGEGCGTHPSAAQHEAMAAELSAFVATKLGW